MTYDKDPVDKIYIALKGDDCTTTNNKSEAHVYKQIFEKGELIIHK